MCHTILLQRESILLLLMRLTYYLVFGPLNLLEVLLHWESEESPVPPLIIIFIILVVGVAMAVASITV